MPTVWYTRQFKACGILCGILSGIVCIMSSYTTLSMGETTTLALNAPNKASLRTTIPMFIVQQWGLKSGDQLDWSFSLLNNEMVVVVRKAG